MNITTELMNSFIAKDKYAITLKGLDLFISNFNKKSLIHIYGGPSTGKTSFALDIAYKNPDKSFIYIDTSSNIDSTPDNCLIFRTSTEVEIVSLLNEISSGICDCIILDYYSNILSKTEHWNSSSYEVMQDALEHIHSLCVKKNITLILLNTLNGKGNPFNENDYLRLNSICKLRLVNYFYEEDIIEIIPEKSRIKDSLVSVYINERND